MLSDEGWACTDVLRFKTILCNRSIREIKQANMISSIKRPPVTCCSSVKAGMQVKGVSLLER